MRTVATAGRPGPAERFKENEGGPFTHVQMSKRQPRGKWGAAHAPHTGLWTPGAILPSCWDPGLLPPPPRVTEGLTLSPARSDKSRSFLTSPLVTNLTGLVSGKLLYLFIVSFHGFSFHCSLGGKHTVETQIPAG